jgi:hypothetical protein
MASSPIDREPASVTFSSARFYIADGAGVRDRTSSSISPDRPRLAIRPAARGCKHRIGVRQPEPLHSHSRRRRMSTEGGSITRWIGDLKAGEAAAARTAFP